jgi:hypothetical protein
MQCQVPTALTMMRVMSSFCDTMQCSPTAVCQCLSLCLQHHLPVSVPEQWGCRVLSDACGFLPDYRMCYIPKDSTVLFRMLWHESIYIKVYVYVCMFRHNYLSVNGIVSFPSSTWLYKYKEEYKQGEMWHCAQKAEISEKICMFQPWRCQATVP